MTEVATSVDGGVRHRFSVDDWQEMGRLGLFGDGARLELIDGEILEMSPIGLRHAWLVDWINRFLLRAVGDTAVLRTQNPVHLDDWSEPQPDFALLMPPIDRYRDHHPRPDETLLVVEVADSSLRYDRSKSRYYAAVGIDTCWIVDVGADSVLVLGDPTASGYQSSVTVRRGARLHVPGLDCAFDVDDLLGPAEDPGRTTPAT
jgi:Uma2 family endonuclease